MSEQTKKSTEGASSRRKFLAGSTAAAAATALPVELSAQVAGSDEIKVGMIGMGGRNSGAIVQNLNANDGARLTAVAEAFTDKIDGTGFRGSGLPAITKQLEKMGKAGQIDVPKSRQYAGFDAYKAVVDQVDLVCIATPPGFRPMHFEYAVAQGKHVFMEKPVCVDAHGFNKVIKAAKEADQKKLKVVVGLQRHCQDSYLQSFQKYQEGAIGEMIGASAYWVGNRPWTANREPGYTEMEFQMRNWQQFDWLSGDHICEQHVHNLDVINWFASGDPIMGTHPVSAQGHGARTNESAKIGEIFNQHFIEYRYGPEENNMAMYSQCRQIPGCWRRVDEEIHGSEGIMIPGKGTITDLQGNVKWQYRKPRTGAKNPKDAEHEKLWDAVLNDKAQNDAYFGAKSSLTAALGRVATWSGQLVNFEEAIASDFNIMPEELSFDANPPRMPDENMEYPAAIPGEWPLPWKA
ncbi:MAG: dehydrogenase [Verrucomicrobiales bacterium]|jgi:predicted dehydrogenase|nr:dehydrogenase [Verrucomicrobiales bacterium]|tara:strand:+ start:4041 stop:5429 length:1389 start_codon:yes stop_codon:yes gene_type:complete